jgi:hypothetical protein
MLVGPPGNCPSCPCVKTALGIVVLITLPQIYKYPIHKTYIMMFVIEYSIIRTMRLQIATVR